MEIQTGAMPPFEICPLTREDIEAVFALMQSNPYYFSCEQDHPVTREEAAACMTDLPPNTDVSCKHFVGWFQDGSLAALMDYIDGYPQPDTLFIGLFMLEHSMQRQGLGRRFICGFEDTARQAGFRAIQLGCIAENEQSCPFWAAMGFSELKRTVTRAEGRRDWNVIVMEKKL